MLSILLSLLDPSTFIGQLFQATLQVLFWLPVFKHLKSYIKRNYGKSSWYLQAISKGDGEAEFLMLCSAIPQHTVCAVLTFLGYYLDSIQLFTMGTHGELAFEFIELFNIFMAKYVYNDCPFKPEMIRSLVFHHLPGILVIIPTNLYFGDNPHIQKISFSLLVIAPFAAVFFVAHKTRDLSDLRQRGQFTVYLFIIIMIMMFFRFYWTPLLMIQFLYSDFSSFSVLSQIMFVFYGALITLFNITFVMILGQRLYRWLYVSKLPKNKLLNKLRNNPIPILSKCKSTPLFFCDSEKKLN